MRLRRLIGPAVLTASLAANAAAAYVFATYVRNHGGMNYVRERLHAGGRVAAVHVASDQERRATFRLVPHVPGQILFLGDSLTQVGPWVDYFPGLPVQNRGVGGSTIRDGINLVHDGVLSGHPAQVFLQFDTNDFGAGVSVDGFLADYAELLDAVHTAAPDAAVVVQGCVPGHWAAGDTADPDLLRAADGRLRALAIAHGATFVELFSHLALNPQRGLPDDFTVDGIHLTPKAYAIWVDVIRPYVGHPTTRPVPAR